MTPTDPSSMSAADNTYDQRAQTIYGPQTNIVGNVTLVHNSEPAVSLRRRYLEEVVQECNLLPWRIVNPHFADPDRSANLRLAEIYTVLDTTLLRPTDLQGEGNLRTYLRNLPQHERVPIQQITDESPRLLILGDPGSGKSTFVKHLAYTLAQALLDAEGVSVNKPAIPETNNGHALQPWSHGLLLPIRIELRHVAAFAEDHRITDNSRLLTQYLQHWLREWGLIAFWPEFDTLLKHPTSQIIFLLDGLDEVATTHRPLLADLINNFVMRHSQHRYLVTCRPYAYVGHPWRLTDFRTATLAPFSQSQIDRFVDNWYTRLAARERIDTVTRQHRLKEALRRSDLRDLAESPLLLTVMTQLHTFTGQLPDDRGQLYADTINLLLQRWENRHDQALSLLGQLAIPGLRLDDLEAALAHVAFQAQRQQSAEAAGATADIQEGELRQWLAPYLNDDWNKAGLFITYIRERAGLLIRHKTVAYTFPHRTFQEYLAACHLVNSADYPTTAADLVCSDPTRWREVFLLSTSRAPVGQAIAAVNALCPNEVDLTADAATWRQALIAGDALREIGCIRVERQPAGQAQLARTRRWLVHALRQDRTLSPAERATAGRTLARLGDPRLTVMTVEEMEFCYVPPGPFIMGSRADDEWADDLERPQHQVDIPYPFWVACLPVTNAQFDQFVTADGYKNADYWSDAIVAQLWDNGNITRDSILWNKEKKELEFPQEITDGPYAADEPYNLPNHPRVELSWYEALAFVRWLNLHFQQLNYLPYGYEVHLPSEAEWEKAARGGLHMPTTPLISDVRHLKQAIPPALQMNPNPTRRFPWGNEYIESYLNARKTDFMIPNTVGTLAGGCTPVGAEEMSCNIHEWTRTVIKLTPEKLGLAYPYCHNDGREDLTTSHRASRIIRGGYTGAERFQGTAARGYCTPYTRYPVYGFRCVIVPIDRG